MNPDVQGSAWDGRDDRTLCRCAYAALIRIDLLQRGIQR
jgi:hypothetical protein